MITVQQAENLILENMPQAGLEQVPVADSIGRVLAETVQAERDQPPFDRSTMDGFALAADDGSESYRIAAIAPAGQPQSSLGKPGECIEIMTGAPIPAGADCVVPVERVDRDGEMIRLHADAQLTAGRFVHARASDHDAGSGLIAADTPIGAPELAVLVSAGYAQVSVKKLPAMAIIASGDELVDVDQPVAPHQIRRSNDYAMQGLLTRHGLATGTRWHIQDDPAAQLKLLGECLERDDGLVLTGGVSMGRYDYIPEVLGKLGVEVIFHRVSQRPGKPMWFGLSNLGKPVFALPGNPVSALVCMRRYVVPALQKMLGVLQTSYSTELSLAEAVDFAPALTSFLPVDLTAGDMHNAHPKKTNTSGDFTALAGTAGFVELALEQKHFPAGTRVPFYPW